jgi:septum formation inhibitor MinC
VIKRQGKRSVHEQPLHKQISKRRTLDQHLTRNRTMKLVPTDPPGRSSRKAKRFAQDMRELRAQGYTFEAIRTALAAVGVHVSNATVQREVARATKAASAAQVSGSGVRPDESPLAFTQQLASAPPPSTATPRSTQAASVEQDMRSGKEIAEAFASSRITNPLARARLHAKDSP